MEDRAFELLLASAEQALAYSRGDTSKGTATVREIPDPVPEYRAGDVARTRKDLNLSQRALADALGVSKRTVEAWEAGRNVPSGAARHLLYLLDTDHALVNRLVAR